MGGFIGKTLNYFRKWASQGILKVSTSDPRTGRSHKIEVSLNDFITDFGSASIEIGPSFVEIIAKKGSNRNSPSTETKIKLDGANITITATAPLGVISKLVLDAAKLQKLVNLLSPRLIQ